MCIDGTFSRTVAIDNPDLPSRRPRVNKIEDLWIFVKGSSVKMVRIRRLSISYLRRFSNTKSRYICHTRRSVDLNLHSTKRLDMLAIRAIAAQPIDSPLAKLAVSARSDHRSEIANVSAHGCLQSQPSVCRPGNPM